MPVCMSRQINDFIERCLFLERWSYGYDNFKGYVQKEVARGLSSPPGISGATGTTSYFWRWVLAFNQDAVILTRHAWFDGVLAE